MTSSNGAGAFNARVRVNEPEHITQPAREQRVSDCDAQVALIREQITALRADDTADLTWRRNRIAALEANLETAEAEAELARAEAQKGRS